MNRYLRLCGFLISIIFLTCNKPGDPVYKDSNASTDQRVRDLLHRMTVEEKARQLDMYVGPELVVDGKLISDKMDSLVGQHGVGSVHDLYPVRSQLANDIQQYLVEKTRLGIPALMISEALHGYQGTQGTCFPAPIGLGAMWDTTLMHKIGRVIGTEARAHGVHFVLSPVLGLAREPRWGRVEETYGEDPYLAAQTGLAMVKGMQGDDLKASNTVISEPKHYAVHSVPEAGNNTAPVHVGEREARETFLYVFETAIKEGGALGVMAAYHEWDGIPCAAHPFLLKELLRDEWGFEGMVLSDLGAIRRLNTDHFTAATPKEAITASLKAGLDMQFMDFSHEVFQGGIIDAVDDGTLTVAELDRAVASVLHLKFELGLFENPYIDTTLVEKYHHTSANQELALEAGRKSICLLKNEDGILPLSKEIKSIAVIGPLADVPALGGYSPKNVGAVTVLQGIKEKFGDKVEVNYEPGLIPMASLSVVDGSFLRTPDNQHSGLLAEYFNNPNLEGVPGFSQVETNMTPYYHNNSPGGGIGADNFTVRWTGTITAPVSGDYEIGIITDDKGRLFLDGELVVDNWEPFQLNVMKTKRVHFPAGRPVPIRMEFGEEVDYAGIRLKWQLLKPDPGAMAEVNDKVLSAVNKSDITVLVLGETSEVVGEGKDKSNLDLNTAQENIAKAIHATGKPIATVLLNGRPLSINWLAGNAPAIVEAWFPGEFGGKAVADILFGDVNPSGKLPVTFPKSTGQLPVYYNYHPAGRKGYVDGNNEPLFPFGHGLSYTTFEYNNLQISPDEIPNNGMATISLDVKNTGKQAGTEVVQLYINDQISSVVTPKMELKGFCRVALNPGETKKVSMKLDPEKLSLWNIDMQKVVEPGVFEVMVGSSSADIRLKGELIVKNN